MALYRLHRRGHVRDRTGESAGFRAAPSRVDSTGMPEHVRDDNDYRAAAPEGSETTSVRQVEHARLDGSRLNATPLLMCLVAAAGAAAGAALVMDGPRPQAAEPITAASLTVIDPVATEDVATLAELAAEMKARGDFAQAVDTLSRALALGPPTVPLHMERGLLRLRQGDLEGARADFNSALALNEQAAAPVAGMGLTLLAAGEHEKAAQCFELAISRDPTLGYAWRGQGEVLAAKDDHTGAVVAFDEALRLDGKDARALVLRARSRALIKEGRGALEDAKRAIELAPYDMDAWYTLGSLHLLRREFEDTIRAADRALAIDPGSEDMLALRAWARSARGQIKTAAADAQAALQLAPEDWRHRAAMMTLARAGEPQPESAASTDAEARRPAAQDSVVIATGEQTVQTPAAEEPKLEKAPSEPASVPATASVPSTSNTP